MTRILVALILLALAGRSRAATVTVQGSVTLAPLDVSVVATGGVAVTALNAGHRGAGGWLYNPINATSNLCISEVGTASGQFSAGGVICIQPGQTYVLTPSIGPVSVVSSDSNHAFAGLGYE
jgi:hypothetical protein